MRALTFDSCVLLTYSHQCNFLNTSIFSDNVWCFRTISYIYCSGIRISHFFKDPLLTFWKMILEKRFEWDLCLLLWRQAELSFWEVFFVVVVQLLNCVWLFVTPRTAACRAPLSFTVSWSLLRSMSIESVMLFNHLSLCRLLLLWASIFPSIRVFSNESTLTRKTLKIKCSGFKSKGLSSYITFFFLKENINNNS